MSAFCEDDAKFQDHSDGIQGSRTVDELRLQILEWSRQRQPPGQELPLLTSAASLIARDQASSCQLRVVFAPLGARKPAEMEGLKLLFRHYSFPSATMSERMQAVTHSFGSRRFTKDNVDVAWAHFLSKSIHAQWQDVGRQNVLGIVETGQFKDKGSQANSTWITSDFFIHVRHGKDGTNSCVTLLCFGAPQPLVDRFQRLLKHDKWEDAVREPYVLFDIIYDELYTVVDSLAWRLADVFRPMERWVLEQAQERTFSATDLVDFAGLHNISKHCIYMNEAVEAAVLTLGSMASQLAAENSRNNSTLTEDVATGLGYRKQIFQSTQLRLKSLEKRITNTISLSFNLVTQHDSRILQNDSSAMKAIAVMTLVFLPATGVASIFSSPFFAVDFESKPRRLQVATCFWIFWVIVLPLTLGIVCLWFWLYRKQKLKTSGTSSQPVKSQQRTWLRAQYRKPSNLPDVKQP